MKSIAFALIGMIVVGMFVGLPLAQAQTNSGSKEIILPSWGNGAPEIAITVKGDWKQKLNKGPDFDVHYLTLNTGGNSIGIYVGHNPQEIMKTDATTTKLTVGTNSVIFYVTQQNGASHAEAIIDGFFRGFEGSGVAQLRLHIMINARNSEQLAEIFKDIETLKPITRANKVPATTR